MRLFIEPTEPLLFRTGRPFNAGENTFADTLFPPTPETLQGAIRAAIAAHWDRTKTIVEVFQDRELVELIGDRSGYGRFRIKGMALGRHKEDGAIERLFPAPLHLQRDKRAIIRFCPELMDDVRSDMPDGMQYLLPDKPAEDKLEPVGWLTEQSLQKALYSKETLIKEEAISEGEIVTYESRLGIGMDNATKTTKEGLLYQLRMVRMRPSYGFVIDIRLSKSLEGGTAMPDSEEMVDDSQTQKLLRLPEQGWITLGGERRAAHFEVLETPESVQRSSVEQAKKGNLLYLATPAVLNGGWQPDEWRDPLIRPIAAAINRYQSIGGWLLTPGTAGGENKIVRRCVPAGSVYFFGRSVTIERPLTDYGWQIGYGIAYAGEW